MGACPTVRGQRSRSAVWGALLLILLGLAGTSPSAAAEYNDGTDSIWWDDSVPAGQLQGVIGHFNYGGNGLYTNSTWREFCRVRKLAMVLLPNQDGLGATYGEVATNGLTGLTNILSYAATRSGHSELTASWLPYVFTGISRGGTLGALNLGWSAGANRTLAVIAFHGNSLANIGSNFPDYWSAKAAADAVPVLYKIAQNDSLPVRQTDIEFYVRDNYFRVLGCPWTTSMDYGAGHASTGGDTYTLQWLGRVIDCRFDAANKGTLRSAAMSNGGTVGVNYTMTSGGGGNCHFTAPATAAYVRQPAAAPRMVWLPPGGSDEWLNENIVPATPVISAIAATPAANTTLQAGCSVSVTASDPFGETLRYAWSVVSKPVGGSAVFASASATTSAVTFSGATGTYQLQVVVTNADANRSATAMVSLFVADDALWTRTSAGAWSGGANWQSGTAPNRKDSQVRFTGASGVAVTQDVSGLTIGGLTFANGSYTLSGQAITLSSSNGTAVIDAGSGTVQTIGTVLSGSAAVSIQGAGAVVLGAAGGWTGGTTVAAGGTLRQGIANALPGGTVTVDGTFDLAGRSATLAAIAGSGSIDTAVAGTAQLTVGTGNASSTFAGIIGDSVGTINLTKIGSGTLTLAAAQQYAGSTRVQGGILALPGAPTVPVAGSSRWFDATTLGLADGAAVSRWTDRSGNGADATAQTAGIPTLIGDAGLPVAGRPAVRCAPNASLNFASDGSIRSVCALFKGTSFLLTSLSGYDFHRPGDADPADPLWASFANGAITGGSTYVNGTLVNGSTFPMPVGGSRNGFNVITVLTTGAVQADGFNRDRVYHTGDQQHAEVLLYDRQLSDAERRANEAYLARKWFGGIVDVLPPGTALTVDAGATVDLAGSVQTVAALDGAGAVTSTTTTRAQLTINASGSATYAGIASGNLAMVKGGNGTWTMSGPGTYTGGTTVSAGTLVVAAGGTLGSGDLTVANGAVCDLRHGAAIADGATVALTGTGRLVLAAGITEVVARVSINGVLQPAGVFSASTDPVHFAGGGALRILSAPTVATAAACVVDAAGTTAALSVLGADDGGEAALTYTWQTIGALPATVAFTTNGSNAAKATTVRFAGSGTYTFQVMISDGALSTTAAATVTVASQPALITVSPSSQRLEAGSTAVFSAAVLDQFGVSMSATPAWLASGGTITAEGRFQAPATAASVVITAKTGTVTGSAQVEVVAATPPQTAGPDPVVPSAATAGAVPTAAAAGGAGGGGCGVGGGLALMAAGLGIVRRRGRSAERVSGGR